MSNGQALGLFHHYILLLLLNSITPVQQPKMRETAHATDQERKKKQEKCLEKSGAAFTKMFK